MWALSGTNVSLGIDYEVDGQFVVPDSATYVVRGYTGVTVTSGSLPSLVTSEVVTVPSGYNALTGSNLFENRWVVVTFIVGAQTYSLTKGYTISGFVPTTATPEAVRSELGLDYQELPNDDIDINRAYFDLLDTYGANMTAAFLTSGVQTSAANQCVVLQAALNVAQSLALRVMISSKAEGHAMARAPLDFDAITRGLTAKMVPLLRKAKGETALTSSVFVLSNPTDVVTGI
jgi:hypothetical protein